MAVTMNRTTQAEAPMPMSTPWHWLVLGWRDFMRNPLPGLVHGTAVAVLGAALLWWAIDQFWWLVGAFTGFLIVAPILASRLYVVSRALEQDQPLTLHEVLHLWLARDRRLVAFGLLLGLAGTAWVLVSAGLVTLWSPEPIHKPADFFRYVVLAKAPGLFEVWLLLGAWLATPVFASSVLTLPLLIDTKLPLWAAVGESWRAVGAHPIVLGVWACLIVVLVTVGMLTAMSGLVVIVPWLGHASWHAYRALYRANS